jgi:hypothetical protein
MRDTKADWEMIYYADSVHALQILKLEMTTQKELPTMQKQTSVLGSV